LVLAAGGCDSGTLDPGIAARAQADANGSSALGGAGFFVGNLVQGAVATNGILRYDGNGAFIDRMIPAVAGGLGGGCCMAFGPDENLYVSSFARGSIRRFHGVTGAFIDEFVPPGSGVLTNPLTIVFRPDGRMYVGDLGNVRSIRRFDAATGAYIDEFIRTTPQGALNGDPQFFAFGPDGNVYVASQQTSRILRYDGTTGAFIDEFIPVGPDGVGLPSGIVFGPDGYLYAGSTVTHEVRRYNVWTKELVDVFVQPGSGGLNTPVGLVFGPDGNLYVASANSGEVLRYDGRTGAFIDEFIPAGRGPINGPRVLEWKSKITMCHRPPGNRSDTRTINVAYMSGFDHVAHGDAIGACVS